jgi:hypothetical protein
MRTPSFRSVRNDGLTIERERETRVTVQVRGGAARMIELEGERPLPKNQRELAKFVKVK